MVPFFLFRETAVKGPGRQAVKIARFLLFAERDHSRLAGRQRRDPNPSSFEIMTCPFALCRTRGVG